MADIYLEWVVDEGMAKKAAATVKQNGGRLLTESVPFEPNEEELDDYGDANFEPLMVLTCALSLAALLPFIVHAINDLRFPGGDFFDLRKGRCRWRPLPSTEKGTIVIQNDDGIVRYSPARRADALKVLGGTFEALVAGSPDE